MTKNAMAVGEFSDLLDRLGPAFDRWSEEQRRAAEHLLAQSPEASALLTSALALADREAAERPKAPDGMVDRIMAAAGLSSTKPS